MQIKIRKKLLSPIFLQSSKCILFLSLFLTIAIIASSCSQNLSTSISASKKVVKPFKVDRSSKPGDVSLFDESTVSIHSKKNKSKINDKSDIDIHDDDNDEYNDIDNEEYGESRDSSYDSDYKDKKYSSNKRQGKGIKHTKKPKHWQKIAFEIEPKISMSLLRELTNCPIPKLNLTKPTITSNVQWQIFVYCVLDILPEEGDERHKKGPKKHGKKHKISKNKHKDHDDYESSYPEIEDMRKRQDAYKFIKKALKKYLKKYLFHNADLTNEQKFAMFERIFLVTKFRMLTQNEKAMVEDLIARKGLYYTTIIYRLNWYFSEFYQDHFDFSQDPQPEYESYEIYGKIIDEETKEPINGAKYNIADKSIKGFLINGISENTTLNLNKNQSNLTYNFHLQFYIKENEEKRGINIPIRVDAKNYMPNNTLYIINKDVTTGIIIELKKKTIQDEADSLLSFIYVQPNPNFENLDWNITPSNWINDCQSPNLIDREDGTSIADGYKWQDFIRCLLKVDINESIKGKYHWALTSKNSAFDLVFIAKDTYINSDISITVSEIEIVNKIYEVLTFHSLNATEQSIIEVSIENSGLENTINTLIKSWYDSEYYKYFDYSQYPMPGQSWHTFSGITKDSDNNSMDNAAIKIMDSSEKILQETATDINGKYEIKILVNDISIGDSIKLQIKKEGFSKQEFSHVLIEGRKYIQNATLNLLGRVTILNGGEIASSAGDIIVEIPPEAVEQNNEFTISDIQVTSLPGYPEIQTANFEIIPSYTFNKPVSMQIKVPEAMINSSSSNNNTQSGKLVLLTRDNENDDWQLVPSIFNKKTNTLLAETDHFSTYIIVSADGICYSNFTEATPSNCIMVKWDTLGAIPPYPTGEFFLKRKIRFPAELPANLQEAVNILKDGGWSQSDISKIENINIEEELSEKELSATCNSSSCESASYTINDIKITDIDAGPVSIEKITGSATISGNAEMGVRARTCRINKTASLPQLLIGTIYLDNITFVADLKFTNVKVTYACGCQDWDWSWTKGPFCESLKYCTNTYTHDVQVTIGNFSQDFQNFFSPETSSYKWFHRSYSYSPEDEKASVYPPDLSYAYDIVWGMYMEKSEEPIKQIVRNILKEKTLDVLTEIAPNKIDWNEGNCYPENPPNINIVNNEHDYLSILGVSANSTQLTWQSDRSGNFRVMTRGNCNSGAIASGNAIGYVGLKPVTTTINVSDIIPGENTIHICVRDAYNMLGDKTYTIFRDDTPPVVTVGNYQYKYMSLTGYKNNNITWRSDSKGVYKVKVNDACGTSSSGTISSGNVNVNTDVITNININDLVIGPNIIRICVTDSNYGFSGQNSLVIIRDEIPPQIDIRSNEHSYISGSFGYSSSDLTWMTNHNSNYEIKTKGDCYTGLSSTGLNSSGTIDAFIPVPSQILAKDLSIGSNSIRICVTGRNGMMEEKSYPINRDDIIPTITADPNLNNKVFAEAQWITLVCNDNAKCESIAYTLDGTEPNFLFNGFISNTSSIEVALGSGEDGEYILRYLSRDAAGNISDVNSTFLVIDSLVPKIVINNNEHDYLSNTGGYSSTTLNWQSDVDGFYEFRLNGDCETGSILGYSGNVNENIPVTTIIDADSIPIGNNSLAICVEKLNGITGIGYISITRDDTPPVVAASPSAGNYNNPINVNLICDDDNCDKIAYTIDNSEPSFNEVRTIANGNLFSNLIAMPDLSQTQLKFIAIDLAGNIGAIESATYTIDSIIPEVTIISNDKDSLSIGDDLSSTNLIWNTSRSNLQYQILIGGNDCSSGSISSGENGSGMTTGSNITSTILAESLVPGTNTIRICVKNLIEKYGSAIYTIFRYESSPNVNIISNEKDHLSDILDFQTTNLTWESNQKGTYEIRINGDCTSGITSTGSNSLGNMDANNPIVSQIKSNDLNEGTNTIHICVKNNNDLEAEIAYTITKDIIPPVIAAYPSSGRFAMAQNIHLLCSDNSKCNSISYTINGEEPDFNGNGTVIENNTATIILGSEGNGTYEIKFRSKDIVGNISAVEKALIEIDNSIPNITINSNEYNYLSINGYIFTGINWQSSRNGSYTVMVNGSCINGKLSTGENAVGLVTADSPINSIIKASDLYPGNNTIRICITDSEGKEAEASYLFIRDDIAPTTVNSPGEGAYGLVQNVKLNCSNNCDKIIYTTDGSEPEFNFDGNIINGTEYQDFWITPNETVTTLKFQAIDKAGNVESIKSDVYIVDSTLPTISIESNLHDYLSINGPYNNSDLVWNTDRDNLKYNIRIGGINCESGYISNGNNGTGITSILDNKISKILTEDLEEGENKIRICVRNLVGDFGYTSYRIIRDDKSPIVTLKENQFNYLSTNGITTSVIQWSSDIYGDYTIRINGDCLNGSTSSGLYGFGNIASNESVISFLKVIDLIEGSNTIHICVKGKNGLMGEKTFNVTRDETHPTTIANSNGGYFTTNQSLTLNCTDNESGCKHIIYTTDGTEPSFLPLIGILIADTTATIPIGSGETTIKFASEDNAGNIEPYQEVTYIISNQGLLYSVAGLYWKKLYFSLDRGESFRMANLSYVQDIFISENKLYVGTLYGLYISHDGGYSFETLDDTNVGDFAKIYITGNKIYSGGNFKNISISTDGGNTFSSRTIAEITGYSTGYRSEPGFNYSPIIKEENGIIYIGSTYCLSISTDSGNTFINKQITDKIYDLDGLPFDGVEDLYISGNTIYSALPWGLAVSTDGGSTFDLKTDNNGLGSRQILNLFVDKDGILYAGTWNGLSISTDGGLTFSNKSIIDGLGISWDTAIRSIFVDHNLIFAGTELGLFISTDKGNTFSKLNGINQGVYKIIYVQ